MVNGGYKATYNWQRLDHESRWPGFFSHGGSPSHHGFNTNSWSDDLDDLGVHTPIFGFFGTPADVNRVSRHVEMRRLTKLSS
jgi:hypothetical protein